MTPIRRSSAPCAGPCPVWAGGARHNCTVSPSRGRVYAAGPSPPSTGRPGARQGEGTADGDVVALARFPALWASTPFSAHLQPLDALPPPFADRADGDPGADRQ